MVNNLWFGLLKVTRFNRNVPLRAVMLGKWLCRSIIDLWQLTRFSPVIPFHHSPSLWQRGQTQRQRVHTNLSQGWQAAKREFQGNFILSFPFLRYNVIYVECKRIIIC